MTLHASLTEPAAGRPGEIVMVIASSGPGEVAGLDLASYGLTSREEHIVRLVARGRSTRQVSAEIFIFGHTVNNHLRNVFEEVGVHSRRELVKRLFVGNLVADMPGG